MGLDRPVLVTGTPRSGKTCVWNLLRQAGEFYAVQEPIMIWSTPGRGRSDDCRTADEATEKVKTRILKRCEKRVKRSGKQRYLDNLAYHALRIPFVHAVLPDVRLIHVVRDPRDAVPEILFGWTRKGSIGQVLRTRLRNINVKMLPRLTWKFACNYVRSRVRGCRETYGPVVPGLAGFVRNRAPAEVAAYQWAKMIEIALEDIRSLPNLKVLEVRHERLVADPRGQAIRIAEFAEVSEPDALIEFAENYLKQDYVHWEETREEQSEDEWKAIRRIIAPLQERLGYDRGDRPNSCSDIAWS